MNIYREFQRLIPTDRLLAGDVTAHNTDGTSTVALPAGGTVRVLGQSVAVGSKAFIQGGKIVSEAPALSTYEITV